MVIKRASLPFFGLQLTLCLLLRLLPATCLNLDVAILMKMKLSFTGYKSGSNAIALLETWNLSNPLCHWRGVEWTTISSHNVTPFDCTSSNLAGGQFMLYNTSVFVYALRLAAAGLRGTFPSGITSLPFLHDLDLSNNHLSGSITPQVANLTNLAILRLSNNEFTGSMPSSIWTLCNQLERLYLDHNHLNGSIPNPSPANSTNCPRLQKLYLNSNRLTGSIPSFLATFTNLVELELSNNSLAGSIPLELAELTKLAKLNLADNNLSGKIPPFVQLFNSGAFTRNSPSLCGPPLNISCVNLQSRQGKASVGTVLALIAALVIIVSVVSLFATAKSSIRETRMKPTSLLTREMGDEGKLYYCETKGEHLEEENFCTNWSDHVILGGNNYSTVYKVKLRDASQVALRAFREEVLTSEEITSSAIIEFGRIQHKNLVPFRFFYAARNGEHLLAYDYMNRGNLEELLHNRRNDTRTGPGWARRHRIALGAAKGLAQLHTGFSKPIMHGNLKSRNVLLDDNYVAHLSDFSVFRFLTAEAAQEMMNTTAADGYKAPELKNIKRVSMKTDVYSFGVMLLEILTGRKPAAGAGDSGYTDLPSLVRQAALHGTIVELFDLELLRGVRNPVDDGLMEALQLAMGCCAQSPCMRPDMENVVRKLQQMQPNLMSQQYHSQPMSMYSSPADSRGNSPLISMICDRSELYN